LYDPTSERLGSGYQDPEASWSRIRERRRSPLFIEDCSQTLGEARERSCCSRFDNVAGWPRPSERGTHLTEFAPRFIAEYAEAERQKPSSIAAKRTTRQTHLIPLLGDKKLDEISDADVQQLKLTLKSRAPKTVNNQLTTLSCC
jgi:hypothetical protein